MGAFVRVINPGRALIEFGGSPVDEDVTHKT
jgi:hypothetical protein